MKGPQMASFAKKFTRVYNAMMQPLCEELNMPETAVDILMYFANNPELNTARDACRFKFLKSGVVSFHIDRMVNEGLLERRSEPGDRRVCRLVCTEKAQPIVEKGRALQMQFGRAITAGLDEATLETMKCALQTINGNLEQLLREHAAAAPGPRPADATRTETEEKLC